VSEETLIFIAFMLSNAFWAFVCFKLVNRLMSRNYHEFVSATRKVTPRKQSDLADGPDPYAESQANQMNSLMVI
jgi:hypothetical protein